MAFIEKQDPTILNIKLTEKGRELLSKGELDFKYFALGDSEIDYEFINENNIDPTKISILKPKDKNPNILSFVKRNDESETLNIIDNLISNTFVVNNNTKNHGFFNVDDEENIIILNDIDYTKQSDTIINLSECVGTNQIRVRKSSSYGTNVNEPSVGDYLMVRWTNPNLSYDTTNFIIKPDELHPILIYKIEEIIGSLFQDNLILILDRNTPDFSLYNGAKSTRCLFYSPQIIVGGSSQYSVDFLENAIFSFFENYNLPNKEIPFWNMSIIFTKEIAGILSTNKNLSQYKTSVYGGFVRYIQENSKKYDALGIIHYTNASPANTYGESLYLTTPTLYLPTIMWHKNNGKMGLKLNATGNQNILNSLNLSYRDLSDENGNIVGKVFNGLKIFVIEDPELLFAMSFKSNRNWTLPNYKIDINTKVNIGCNDCLLSVDFNVVQPLNIGEYGSIELNNIIMTDFSGKLLVILTNIDTNTNSYQEYTHNGNVVFNDLNVGNYHIKVYDLNAPDCIEELEFSIEEPNSQLSIEDIIITN